MRSLLLALVPLALACSPSSPNAGGEPSPASARAEPEPSADANGETSSADPAGETSAAAAEDEAGDEDDVIEIEGPETERAANVVPIRAIELVDAQVEWTKVATLDDPAVELVPVASGVVAESPVGVFGLGKGGLERLPSVKIPVDAQLLGHWPRDVWAVNTVPLPAHGGGRLRFRYTLQHLDRELTWSPQRIAGEDQWVGDAQALRKGWLAGVLVRSGSSLTRIGSRKDAPKIGMRMGKVVLDVVESASGRLYNVSLRPNGVYVQAACFSQSCVEDQAKKLPLTSDWEFGAQVPRQRHSFSMLAKVTVDGVVSHQLLHYETGGWSLETLVHEPTGMWPTAAGGLWLLVADELRYRTVKGQWYAVPAPEGASKLSVAVDLDLETVWVVAKVGGESTLWSTAADPELE